MVCGCLYIYDKFTKHDRFTKHDKYTNEADAMIYTEDHITPVAAAEYNVSEFCVVIDAGHGGSDEGTAGGEVVEKDINFSVAMKLKAVLEDNKIQVVLTRSSDENISLTRRTLAANKSSTDFFISLHCNYYEEDAQIAGLECYYSSREAGESRAYAKSIIHAVSISDDIRAGMQKPGTIMFCGIPGCQLFWWIWDFFQMILSVRSCPVTIIRKFCHRKLRRGFSME